MALDVTRLATLAPAVQRRLLRYAAEQLGAAPDFTSTEALRTLALVAGRAGQKLELAQGLRAERTPRELRLDVGAAAGVKESAAVEKYCGAIPGEIVAPAFGLRLNIQVVDAEGKGRADEHGSSATLRNWRPGDRVRLRHSGGLRKVKEVLERLKVTGSRRALWPVLEADGRIVWMKGVELEPDDGFVVVADSLEDASEGAGKDGGS
jgi:tRNA(Ile)-lysidine synthase